MQTWGLFSLAMLLKIGVGTWLFKNFPYSSDPNSQAEKSAAARTLMLSVVGCSVVESVRIVALVLAFQALG